MADVRSAARKRHRATSPTPLSRVLGQVERLVSRIVETALLGHGLTVDQWRVLDILADGEGHAMSELAAAIVVPGPTLTKIADRLVDNALVYRVVDESDRRRVLAFLSDKGERIHADLRIKVGEAEAEALAELGSDDSEILLALLTRLAELQGGPATSRP